MTVIKLKSSLRLIIMTGLLVGLVGCSSLMHPKATEYYNQAEGKTAVEKGLSLVSLMNRTIQEVMNEPNASTKLDELHDQFHALHKVFCGLTEAQEKTEASIYARTLDKEMKTIFHRLWKYRDQPNLRNLHLGLLAARLNEFRMALQGIT